LFHLPIFIVTTIGNTHPTIAIYNAYHIVSKTEVAFTVQEAIITGAYIYLFVRFTKDLRHEPETKSTLRLLFGSEILVLVVDIALNILLYTKIFLVRQMIQAFLQAFKLRIEFVVLNSLVDYSQFKSQREVGLHWSNTVDAGIKPMEGMVLPDQKSADHIPCDDIEAGPSQDSV
jgi:hypothetical protein